MPRGHKGRGASAITMACIEIGNRVATDTGAGPRVLEQCSAARVPVEGTYSILGRTSVNGQSPY
ncbi:MAG: Ni,Fe-hydrogenase maturation factor [Gammaproteobacteria bacterium]|jgi:Ni,Fe-hydrogenase maturation factor